MKSEIDEIWNQIDGFEFYSVSNLGRIKRQYKTHEKILPGNLKKGGYLSVTLSDGKLKKCELIHRLVAYAFLNNTSNKRTINHIDGDKKNNSLSNLEWCTYSENMLHSYRTLNRKPTNGNAFGPHSKLSKEEVIYVRDSDLSLTKLSKLFGVSISTISQIKNRKMKYSQIW